MHSFEVKEWIYSGSSPNSTKTRARGSGDLGEIRSDSWVYEISMREKLDAELDKVTLTRIALQEETFQNVRCVKSRQNVDEPTQETKGKRKKSVHSCGYVQQSKKALPHSL
jgi:hypothetical protein